MSDPDLLALARSFSDAPVMDTVPEPVDVRRRAPHNPPQFVQEKFVGLSFENAYLEASSFVSVVREKVAVHGLHPLDGTARIIDFGSGWGRISRMLLNYVRPTSLYAVDVDPEMTALVNSTMPGLNALTVSGAPPTVLGEGAFDGVLSFSVFSHLSQDSHVAWAQEFGRLVRPGGFAAITILDASLFDSVRSAQREMEGGSPSPFAVNMSTTFPDVEAAARAFADGQFQFAPVGEDGARENATYGWAAAPTQFIEETWGASGFRVLEMVPANVLFPQALVIMERRQAPAADVDAPTTRRGLRRWRRTAG